jgi:hypothetical protein
MSDYVRRKAIRYKLKPDEVNACPPDEYGDIDCEVIGKNYDIPGYVYDIEGERKNCFVIGSGYNDKIRNSEYYIDYLLGYQYGDCAGDFSFVRELNETENEKYMKIFKEKFGDYVYDNDGHTLTLDELRFVDYCYYNGVDEPSIWEFEEI